MNHLPEINTSRLHLRASAVTNTDDIDALYEIYSNPKVVRYLDFLAWTDKSQAKELIQSGHDGLSDDSLFGWCITLKDTNRVIGTCALFDHAPEHKTAEIAFALHPDYWGHGYVTEILPSLINFGFTNLNLNRIHADVEPRNAACLKSLLKAGFQQEGRLRQCWIYPGEEPSDTILLGLLKNEWLSNKK